MGEALRDFRFEISERAREYLIVQRGAISDLAQDHDLWERAYHKTVFADFESLLEWLPAKVESVLDIGGGMGGLDVLLHHHFGCAIAILDGLNDSADMRQAYFTHSNAGVAAAFLEENGVPRSRFRFIDPNFAHFHEIHGEFDMIVSLQAWCFHVRAEVYSNMVENIAAAKASMIVDVRRGWHFNPAPWPSRRFGFAGLIADAEKCRRILYRAA